MDTLVRNWILCRGPREQNRPREVRPSSSATDSTTLPLQSWPGRDCLRPSAGPRSSPLLCAGGTRVQVTRLRGPGRQAGSAGTVRGTGFLEPDVRPNRNIQMLDLTLIYRC